MKTIEEINEIAPYHPLEWQQGYGIWQDGFMEGQKSGADEQKAIDDERIKKLEESLKVFTALQSISLQCHPNLEANLEEGGGYISWERFRNAYRDGAIDREKAMIQEMAKLNEEWRENLAIQRAMLVDKACEWLRLYLPRVIENYPFNGGTVAMLNEDMREEFRKAMEG